MPPPAPNPAHLLRSHTAPIGALAFSDDNERIYSADATGRVVAISTRTLRPIAAWSAHTDNVLGVEEWGTQVVTHGRDNKLHVWRRPDPPAHAVGGSSTAEASSAPDLLYSMDVNALNFCRFSLLRNFGHDSTSDSPAMIAVPNLVDSGVADVWQLPSRTRIHAAIGRSEGTAAALDGRGDDKRGILMSLHLHSVPHPQTSAQTELRLLAGYENGSVALWSYAHAPDKPSIEGRGWQPIWTVRLHKESVMSMQVSRDNRLALTCSADHLIGRYDLSVDQLTDDSDATRYKAVPTKHAGNGCIALRDDGRVCAIGGWDGKVRLYSTKTFKLLGVLAYHKSACQALAFARPSLLVPADGSAHESVGETIEVEDDMSESEKVTRARWLVSGGRDTRVAVWPLMSFNKP